MNSLPEAIQSALTQAITTAEVNEALRKQLIQHINHLLLNDFGALIQLLYKTDVDEHQLKQLLAGEPQTDAAILITDLIIQRQRDKSLARQRFQQPGDIPEDEAW